MTRLLKPKFVLTVDFLAEEFLGEVVEVLKSKLCPVMSIDPNAPNAATTSFSSAVELRLKDGLVELLGTSRMSSVSEGTLLVLSLAGTIFSGPPPLFMITPFVSCNLSKPNDKI